jgi:hypothetical protein
MKKYKPSDPRHPRNWTAEQRRAACSDNYVSRDIRSLKPLDWIRFDCTRSTDMCKVEGQLQKISNGMIRVEGRRVDDSDWNTKSINLAISRISNVERKEAV